VVQNLSWNETEQMWTVNLQVVGITWPDETSLDCVFTSGFSGRSASDKRKSRENSCFFDSLKVARSDFRVTIQFNFDRLTHHHYQSNRKSNVSGVLEKDESFK